MGNSIGYRGSRIDIGEAHAVSKHPSTHIDGHGVHHHPTHAHTGHEGLAHHLIDWSDELFSRRVQEGDTLWHLSERYLGDGNKWPYLQSACELDHNPRHLMPGRPITHHCIKKAKEEARHHHDHNPFHHDHHAAGSSHHGTAHTKLIL